INVRVHDIYDNVHHHNDEGIDHHDGLHHVVIKLTGSSYQATSQARPAKHLFGQHRSTDEADGEDSHQRYDRDHGGAQRMAGHHLAFNQALGASGANVIVIQHVQHHTSGHASDIGGFYHTKSYCRKYQPVQVI